MRKSLRIKSLCTLSKGRQIDTGLLDNLKPYKYLNGGLKESGYYDQYNTDSGTVTISEGGASCGFVNYIEEPFWCGCHCYKLSNPIVDSKYLYWALKSSQKRLMELRTGAAMPNIRKTSLENMLLNVDIDPEKQTSILGVLETVSRSVAALERVIFFCNELIKSRFIELFPEGGDFKHDTLSSITTKITDGSHNPPKGVTFSEYIMASSQNVNDVLNLNDVRYLSKEDFDRENKRTDIQKGDILFTIVGTIGRTYVIKSEKMVFQRSVAVIKPKKNVINSIYLKYFLSSDFATKQIDIAAHGVAQKGIYLSNLRELDILVPKIEVQDKFASFVAQVDKLKFNVKKRIELYQELLNKKMDEYFN